MKRSLGNPAGFFMEPKKTTFICEIIEIIIYLKYSREMDGPCPVRDLKNGFIWVSSMLVWDWTNFKVDGRDQGRWRTTCIRFDRPV